MAHEPSLYLNFKQESLGRPSMFAVRASFAPTTMIDLMRPNRKSADASRNDGPAAMRDLPKNLLV